MKMDFELSKQIAERIGAQRLPQERGARPEHPVCFLPRNFDYVEKYCILSTDN